MEINVDIVNKTRSYIDGDFVWQVIVTSPLYIKFFNEVINFHRRDELICIHMEIERKLGIILNELKNLDQPKKENYQINIFDIIENKL